MAWPVATTSTYQQEPQAFRNSALLVLMANMYIQLHEQGPAASGQILPENPDGGYLQRFQGTCQVCQALSKGVQEWLVTGAGLWL